MKIETKYEIGDVFYRMTYLEYTEDLKLKFDITEFKVTNIEIKPDNLVYTLSYYAKELKCNKNVYVNENILDEIYERNIDDVRLEVL